VVRGRGALVLLLAAYAASVRATGTLQVTATATLAEQATLVVAVRNAGAASVSNVVPVVLYQGRERHGDPRPTLAPGEAATWSEVLPSPTEPGSVPAVVEIHYEDARGSQSIPAVATVSTPGLLPEPEVRASLTAAPVRESARAELLLDNPTAFAIHGRLIILLPAGLSTEPTSQAAEVPANGRRAVPLVIQNDGAAPSPGVPVVALFEYGTAGRRHLATAAATVPIVGGRPPVSPLVVGSGALAVAVALCGLAWWRAARRHGAAP
jgi:hypothetical protein